MASFAGSMRLSMNPAGDARARTCGRYGSELSWQLSDLVDAGTDAKKAFPAFIDVPAISTHRHRRPWRTS